MSMMNKNYPDIEELSIENLLHLLIHYNLSSTMYKRQTKYIQASIRVYSYL